MTDLRKMSLFRDVQVALDFQQMAAEGYIDTEFTMFGVAYYKGEQRHYMISANESKLIDFIEIATTQQILTTPLQQLTDICHVPSGERENIAHEVKIRLARDLQTFYPNDFMKLLSKFNTIEGHDLAKPLLAKMCKKIANSFSSEKLSIVEALVNDAYRRKCLTTTSYLELISLINDEWENLSEDIIPKDTLKKTWYTLAFLDQEQQPNQLINARKEWIYQKKYSLEKDGLIVAPIYKHTYWYNTQMSLDKIRNHHQTISKELFNSEYMNTLLEMSLFPPAFDSSEFEQAISICKQHYGQKALETLQYYGRLWRQY